jgi:uncharacterized membrane protein YqjE
MNQTRPAIPPSGPLSPPQPDSSHSIGEIVGGLASDVQELVRGEIALARAEFDEKLHRVILAAIWLLGGALLGFAGLVVGLEGIAALLALVLPVWVAAMIVGLVIIIVGAVFAKSGVAMLSLKELSPDRTAANVQRDAHMLKEHV